MPPDLQPTLIGKTILIRPIAEADWDGMFAAASDPKIWEVHPAHNRWQEPVFRTFFDNAIRSKSAFTFVERDSGAIIGSSRYADFNATRRDIEIGWTFLIRRLWGTGANREIKRLMLAHAFTFLDTALFLVGEDNVISRKAMEKIGGVARPELVYRPPLGGHVVFEITKDSFAANPYWRD